MNRSHAIHPRATPRRMSSFRPYAESLEGRVLLSAGDLDAMFGNGGSVLLSSTTAKDFGYAVEIQPDGKILAAGGNGTFGSSDRFEVVRMSASGELDTAFGSSGWATPLVGGYLSDMALQRDPATGLPDGRILLAGSVVVSTGGEAQNDIAIVRLLSDGTLDPSFGQAGKVIIGLSTSGIASSTSPAYYDKADAVAVQSDGKILVGGHTFNGATTGLDSFLLRYNVDGSLDSNFGLGGVVETAWSTIDDNIGDIVIQSDGKIVVAGKGFQDEDGGNHPYYVARYDASGSVDTSFGVVGVATTPFGTVGSDIATQGNPLALQPDGSIVFARMAFNGTDYDLALARFTASGALDTTFGDGTGSAILHISTSTDRAFSVIVQSDGKLVVAGTSQGNPMVARFLQNGVLDSEFGIGGLVISAFPDTHTTFHDLALQADGKIVAAGWATVPNGKKGTTTPLLVSRLEGTSPPGIVVSPTSGLVTTESGAAANFSVVLTTQPTANVIVPLNSSDTTEGTVSTSNLTFTPANWSVPQAVTITGVDDALVDGDVAFAIILGPATSADSDYNGLDPSDVSATNTDDDIPPTKFYVVNDGSPDRTFEYGPAGSAVENYALNTGNTAPRGATSTTAGDRIWVVDANKKVYVYDDAGSLFGSWTAGSLAPNATVEGIATDGTDVWIVDARQDKVFRYAGAATRLSGSQNAASSFNLGSGNTSPKDIVTDGASLWIVDDAGTDKVFKYSLAGSLLGSWTISGAGSSPTGITLDPSGGTLWVVDSGTDRVYQFDDARGRTSGSQPPSTSFALAAGNTNPQGLADPPAGASLAKGSRLGTPDDTRLDAIDRALGEIRRSAAIPASETALILPPTPVADETIGQLATAWIQSAKKQRTEAIVVR